MPASAALFIIDAQYDFCNPDGSLYVPGAENDMALLCNWIQHHGHQLDRIYYSLDTHPARAIYFTDWFIKPETGQHAAPFSEITLDALKQEAWVPLYRSRETFEYVEQLEARTNYHLITWPRHCVVGSQGHTLDAFLYQTLQQWQGTHTGWIVPVVKGLHELSEHYGVFAAELPDPDYPTTQRNESLLNELRQFDMLIWAGEARTHCVAKTILQLSEFAPDLIERSILLNDCTSPIPGFETLSEPIYNRVQEEGFQFARTKEFSL